MNEFEIFANFLEQKNIVQDLELEMKFCENDKEQEQLKGKIVEANKKVDRLRKQLVETPDKSYSENTKQSIIIQLRSYIEEISKKQLNLKLSKPQGVVLENELFSKLINDINYVIFKNPSFLRTPFDIPYTLDAENSLDKQEFIDFLTQEIEILNKHYSLNYLDLLEYKEKLIQRIRHQFIKEDNVK